MIFQYKRMRAKNKKIAIMMGICFVAGSLSACGADNSVTSPGTDMEEAVNSANGQGAATAPIGMEDLEEDIRGNNIQNTEGSEALQTSAEVETTPVSDEPEEVSITISAAGDVTLGNYLNQEYSWSFDEMYAKQQNPAYFFESVYDIFAEDDMTIVNLEGPLTTGEEYNEKRYTIKGAPEYVHILTAGSVEAVSMANNHRLDYKEQGTKDTVAALESVGIAYAYDENVDIFETKGIRIGMISVNEVGDGAAVERYIQDGIAKLREQEADLILLSCHWGIEKDNYPESYQQELGRKAIDWGVDLVIGHHPHVLQGIEEYQGKYIIYSLANFCFGANRNPSDKDTMIFRQTFHFVDGERTEETSINVIPCSVSSVTHRNDYQPTPATGEEANRIIGRINEYSRDFGVQIPEWQEQ